jgi:hypothetical protein
MFFIGQTHGQLKTIVRNLTKPHKNNKIKNGNIIGYTKNRAD